MCTELCQGPILNTVPEIKTQTHVSLKMKLNYFILNWYALKCGIEIQIKNGQTMETIAMYTLANKPCVLLHYYEIITPQHIVL